MSGTALGSPGELPAWTARPGLSVSHLCLPTVSPRECSTVSLSVSCSWEYGCCLVLLLPFCLAVTSDCGVGVLTVVCGRGSGVLPGRQLCSPCLHLRDFLPSGSPQPPA